jgi:SAM-dependent methyltransferase
VTAPWEEVIGTCITHFNLSMVMWRAEELFLLRPQQMATPVLDVGCGDGKFFSFLGQEGETYGCDISLASLGEPFAGSVPPYVSVCCADAAKLPYRAGRFETIICNCVLEHIVPLEDALSEFYRVLRPGGVCYITVPTPELHGNLLAARILSRLGLRFLAKRCQKVFNRVMKHYHVHDKDTWEALMAAHGLQVADARYYLSTQSVWVFEVLLLFRLVTLIKEKTLGGKFLFSRKWLAKLAGPYFQARVGTAVAPGAGLFLRVVKT